MVVDETDHIALLAGQVAEDNHSLFLDVRALGWLASRGDGAPILRLFDDYALRHVRFGLVKLGKDTVDLFLHFLLVISLERYKVLLVEHL